MMNILMVAHSTAVGGAESAFKNLVRLAQGLDHRVIVLAPDTPGELTTWCTENKLECLTMPMQPACPNNTPLSFYQVSQQDFKHLAAQLQKYHIDLVITNTAVIQHGAALASAMKVPHIVVAHELMVDGTEMQSNGIPSESYLKLIARTADHVLCCSEAVQDQFKALKVDTATGVLYPFTASERKPTPLSTRLAAQPEGDPFHLLFVGVQSNRKNPVFALTAMQALRLRGRNVVLHFIGNPGPQTPRLNAAIQHRGLTPFVQAHPHTATPFDLVQGRQLNLVCATSEPFGLTITEALERGIPVVASRSGGPQHFLPEDCLFNIDDLDRCVRLIEGIMDDYPKALQLAAQSHETLSPRVSRAHQSDVLSQALASAQKNYRDKPDEFFHGRKFFNAINLEHMSESTIVQNIAEVSGVPVAEITELVAKENRKIGSMVTMDCQTYDVVPFAPSANMDNLYREGLGFAVELGATYSGSGRQLMSALIVAKLMDEASRKPIRTLAFGDGIGIDTLRLSAMGFDVDYIDFDSSLTGRIARKNFETYQAKAPEDAGKIRVIGNADNEPTYDSIVCLEVIEHVSDPVGFLRYLASRLSDNGVLFISECFDGVQNFWPTHLLSNEDLGGMLPIMGAEVGLRLEDCNQNPAAKPYVFRKVVGESKVPGITELLKNNKNMFRSIIGAQLKIGL